MRIETLLTPGNLSNGIALRTEACKAISSVEITAMRTPGHKVAIAKVLEDFFTDCATKMNTLHEEVVPTITAQVATSAVLVTLTFSEAMDQTVAPAISSFAITGDTITAFTWVNSTHATLTGTGFAAAESLVYTKPAVSYLRDLAGNALATATVVLA